MVRTDFYNHGRRRVSIWYMFLAFAFSIYFNSSLTAQSMACNDSVQVSLDENCEAEITPAMILEGEDESSDLSEFVVDISGVTGTTVTTPGTYSVTVTNTNTNNSCWGDIVVEDKLAPQVITCPCPVGNTDPDCTFLCTDEEAIVDNLFAVPTPVVEENCGPMSVNMAHEVIDNGCGSKLIRRTYLFNDAYGNQSTECVSEFILEPVQLTDVTPPVNPVELSCGANTSMPAIVEHFTPIVGYETALTYAYPTVNGTPLNGNLCNLVSGKTDTELPACGSECTNSVKIIRNWLILDWCTGESQNLVQIIKASDSEAPTISVEGFTKSVDPWGCIANFHMPYPDILHDNCSDDVSYTVNGPIGVSITFDVTEGLYLVQGAPKGTHTFQYIAEDCCGNTTVEDVTVEVLDLTAPIAVAKQNIVISLTNSGDGEGIAKLYAASVDNGSHDGCTDVHIEIRREEDPTKDEDGCGYTGNLTYNDDGHSFDGSSNPNSSSYDPDGGAFVKFCCSDLTDVEGTIAYGIVKVWMRVWDDADLDGNFGSSGDNYNETWAYVRVEDKLPPQIVCPPEITISCEDDCDDLDLVGEATASSNCLTLETTYSDIEYLDGCGAGYVLRRWSIVNSPEIFCIQRINKTAEDPFDGDDIVWPNDMTTDCTNLPNSGKPTWSAGPCDLIGYSIESDTFQFEDGACYKIINHWTVIDWCQYEPNGFGNDGIWDHYQVIKVLDDEAPVIDDCDPKMYEVDDNGDVDNDGDKCETRNLMLTNSAMDNGDCASDWLKWTVLVDLWGDGTWEYEFSSFLPSFDSNFNDTNGNGIPDRYVAPTSSGEEVKITIPEDIWGSMDNHRVSWKVSDGCGNITSCLSTFMVVDKKAPTPYCVNISSALMNNGQVELWARDFDLGSFDNCTSQEDLLFTFDQAHPVLDKITQEHYFKGQGEDASQSEYNSGSAQLWVPGTFSSAKVFNCNDLPTVDIVMSVWDEKLNTDYCSVVLNLVDNQGACGEGQRVSVAGNVLSPTGEQIMNAEVNLIGSIDDLNQQTLNKENGYTFDFVAMNYDYNIEASKTDDYLNGVSTLDIVLIQRHILGLSKFEDAYSRIAGDVTNDEKVSASDLVQLRKLILGLIDVLPNNDSWRFLDPSTVMDQEHPWPLDETINIVDLHENMQDQNLMAIKIGDVNNSVEISANKSGELSRNSKTTTLDYEDKWLEAGEEYTVELRISDNTNIYGFQASFNTYDAEIVNVTSDVFEITNNNIVIGEGVSVSVTNPEGSVNGSNVINILIKANTSGYVSEKLMINDKDALTDEVYLGESLTTYNVELNALRSIDKVENFIVYQNEPNPFNDKTNIKFFLPESGMVSLEIYDITGKIIYNVSSEFSKGENSIVINKQTLGGHGVFYYQIQSGNYSDTKKMISLE